MMAAIKASFAILSLVVQSYNYSTPLEFVEMVGYATNAHVCKSLPLERRHLSASCASFCAAEKWWISQDDIDQEIGAGICDRITEETKDH